MCVRFSKLTFFVRRPKYFSCYFLFIVAIISFLLLSIFKFLRFFCCFVLFYSGFCQGNFKSILSHLHLFRVPCHSNIVFQYYFLCSIEIYRFCKYLLSIRHFSLYFAMSSNVCATFFIVSFFSIQMVKFIYICFLIPRICSSYFEFNFSL